MAGPNMSEQDERENQLSRHESFIAEVPKHRNPVSGGEASKSHWEILANSNALTALITVLGTAFFGTLLAARIQERSRRAERALVEHKEHVNAEVDTVKRAYELAGKDISACEDLIAITGPEFDPRRYEAEKRKELENQKAEIRKQHNTIDAEWRHNRESLGYLISFYHHGRTEVITNWRDVQEAMEQYNACASDWSNNHPVARKEELIPPPCKAEKDRVRQQLGELNLALEKIHSDSGDP